MTRKRNKNTGTRRGSQKIERETKTTVSNTGNFGQHINLDQCEIRRQNKKKITDSQDY